MKQLIPLVGQIAKRSNVSSSTARESTAAEFLANLQCQVDARKQEAFINSNNRRIRTRRKEVNSGGGLDNYHMLMLR